MMKSILRTGAATLVALALAGLPVRVAAQSTNASAASKKAEKADTTKTKKSAHPFHGKLAKVDKTAKTITVGNSVYQVTADTKITKGGKVATLEDATEGEVVTGYAKPDESGKKVATSLTLGGSGKKSSSQGSAKSADKQPGAK